MKTRNEMLEEFYDSPPEALFKSATIAAVLDVPRNSLERDRWAGQGIPFLKLGRAIRYRKSDVLAWMPEATIPEDKPAM